MRALAAATEGGTDVSPRGIRLAPEVLFSSLCLHGMSVADAPQLQRVQLRSQTTRLIWHDFPQVSTALESKYRRRVAYNRHNHSSLRQGGIGPALTHKPNARAPSSKRVCDLRFAALPSPPPSLPPPQYRLSRPPFSTTPR